MIREVTRDDIPVCVDIIRKSFKTVAEEFGFTRDNAPRFTAFATTEERLYWQMDNEPRLMFVYEQNGVICGYYSLLMQDNNECELNNLAVLPEYRHCGIGKTLLEHAYETARNQGCKRVNIGLVGFFCFVWTRIGRIFLSFHIFLEGCLLPILENTHSL